MVSNIHQVHALPDEPVSKAGEALEAAVRHLGVLIPDWSEVSVQSSDWIINDTRDTSCRRTRYRCTRSKCPETCCQITQEDDQAA